MGIGYISPVRGLKRRVFKKTCPLFTPIFFIDENEKDYFPESGKGPFVILMSLVLNLLLERWSQD